ncbi:MAG: DEAD/DEAH box helicase [Planctomycetota bacterium]
MRATLRPYQRRGVAWLTLLARLGLGACLADDMGLGKTIQVIAALLVLAREGLHGPHLLVLPTTLLGNWQAELARFAPHLRVFVAHRSEVTAADLAAPPLDAVDVVLTTYGTLPSLAWAKEREFGLVVLDEAQAIKNPGTRQAKSVKALHARARVALTGTPVENRLGDLWSLFDFLDPGLLGSAGEFTKFTKRLTAEGGPGYAPLRRLLRPYILRRMKSDPEIAPDLPEKTEMQVLCGLSPAQVALYEATVSELAASLDRAPDEMERRGLVLSSLLRLKQICDHPALGIESGLESGLGSAEFAPEASGKFQRLAELCEELAARQERVLVFTQFRELTGPLDAFLAGCFGRPGLVLHGGTATRRRAALVAEFQREGGPPYFVLSLKAGGTGLNLTAANHVVHFDRWWNPAVENQATDRAFRIGQRKNVLVHAFTCRGTIEERIDALLRAKRRMAEELLERSGEVALTELSSQELLRLVKLDVRHAAL